MWKTIVSYTYFTLLSNFIILFKITHNIKNKNNTNWKKTVVVFHLILLEHSVLLEQRHAIVVLSCTLSSFFKVCDQVLIWFSGVRGKELKILWLFHFSRDLIKIIIYESHRRLFEILEFLLTLPGQTVHSVLVRGFRNRPKSDLFRNPQQYYIYLIFFAVLDSTVKYVKHCTVQNCSKNRRICGIRIRICGIQNTLWNPQKNNETFVWLHWAVAESATVSGILKL